MCQFICKIFVNNILSTVPLLIYLDPGLLNQTGRHDPCTHIISSPAITVPASPATSLIVQQLNSTTTHPGPPIMDQSKGPSSLPDTLDEEEEDLILDELDEALDSTTDQMDFTSFPIEVYSNFKHIIPDIRNLLIEYKGLHPTGSNDMGDTPGYTAILSPIHHARFLSQMPRKHDDAKAAIGIKLEAELLSVGVIEPSTSPHAVNVVLTPKALPFISQSNTRADRHIAQCGNKTTMRDLDAIKRKQRYTVDMRSPNSQLVPAPCIHLPKSDEVLKILHGNAVFSLDVSNAFRLINYKILRF